MNKTTSTILLLIILAAAGYFFITGARTEKPGSDTTYQSDTTPVTESPIPPTPSPSPSGASSANTHLVSITDAGFSPKSLTIKVGDTVTWKNESSDASWPASAIHPTHRGYPTTGGCLGSTFDACRGMAPGESWSFTFDAVGEWGYHDHVNPAWSGKIIVIK